MSVTRKANSPPGTLRPPGMQKRWYSSGVRVSRITSLSPRSMRACSSVASISGTWCSTSILSPKSLLITLLPHSVGSPSVLHWLMPRSKTETLVKPICSRVPAARVARRPSSSQTMMFSLLTGAERSILNSNSLRGIKLESAMCELLYSPASRTSISANLVLPCSRAFRSEADIVLAISIFLLFSLFMSVRAGTVGIMAQAHFNFPLA